MTNAFEPCFKGIWVSDFPYVLRMDRNVFFVVFEVAEVPFFGYRDFFWGIEILHSVVQHLDRLLPWNKPVRAFLGLQIL